MTLLSLKGTVRKRETNAAPGVIDPSPSSKVKTKLEFHKLARVLSPETSQHKSAARTGVPAGA